MSKKKELKNVLKRVSEEHTELMAKFNKLYEFLHETPNISTKVSPEQYDLLWAQKAAMESYISILEARINGLKSEIKELKKDK